MVKARKRQIIAIACGLIAALAMAFYASSVRAEASQGREEALAAYGGEQIDVFVATRDIAVGETLSAENATLQPWVSDLLPLGAMTEQAQVFGQTTVVPLLKNEPILTAKLGEVKAPVTVPENMCAVSIPSDDVLAVGGAIRSGAYVTIYSSSGNAVELIAEEVLVLDTSNEIYAGADKSSGLFGDSTSRPNLAWVTLAVEPEAVQELIAASTSQQLHLVLPGGVLDE